MRPTRDDTLINVAADFARRSTCDKLHVGAVISHDGRPLSTGYNGSPAGMAHCRHLPVSNDPCVLAVHAEANAIAYAARFGVATVDAEMHVTHSPCYKCAQLIINAGIFKVTWAIAFRDQSGLDLLESAGIETVHYRGVIGL